MSIFYRNDLITDKKLEKRLETEADLVDGKVPVEQLPTQQPKVLNIINPTFIQDNIGIGIGELYLYYLTTEQIQQYDIINVFTNATLPEMTYSRAVVVPQTTKETFKVSIISTEGYPIGIVYYPEVLTLPSMYELGIGDFADTLVGANPQVFFTQQTSAGVLFEKQGILRTFTSYVIGQI
jgi:hypothetical protein